MLRNSTKLGLTTRDGRPISVETAKKTGQLLTAQSPRTDLTAKTSYGYAGGTTGGTLLSITGPIPSPAMVTTINTATGGGRPKKITDPNGILTTLSWTPRNWLSSSV